MKWFSTVIPAVLITLSVTVSSISFADSGFELDALPYATGGYYASFWHGIENWRIRGVISQVNIPDFSIKDGFTDADSKAYALIADRFIGKNAASHEGTWVGAGIEYWQNSIRRSGFDKSSRYDSYVLTAGAGYIWNITDRVYLNPWFAGHLLAGGDRNVSVSGRNYSPQAFMAEASFKLGWRF